jgi:demethylmenaquinone methyltransferase/2-methoxy-6-polyprenyl-1,4-benzoquinol methylase
MKPAKTFFDEFSERYDAENRYKYQWYRSTVDNVIKQINREKPVILDLGTGNGEIAIRAALKFPNSSVVGIDVSSGMINEAEKKVRKMGLKNVTFIVSPMENLKIERADFVVSNLAFHHVKNKRSVISEICNILPRKGKLIIGDWFKPTRAYTKEIEKLRAKNPTLSKKFDESWQDFLSEPSMREYSERHPKEYPISQAELESMMKKAGFRKQKTIRMPMATFAVVVGEK